MITRENNLKVDNQNYKRQFEKNEHKKKQHSNVTNHFGFGEVDPEFTPRAEFVLVAEVEAHLLGGITRGQGTPVVTELTVVLCHFRDFFGEPVKTIGAKTTRYRREENAANTIS